MFGDDIILIGEEVNNRLDQRRSALERKKFKISRNKTEYIQHDFGGRGKKVDGTRRAIKISGDVIGEVENFKYLG